MKSKIFKKFKKFIQIHSSCSSSLSSPNNQPAKSLKRVDVLFSRGDGGPVCATRTVGTGARTGMGASSCLSLLSSPAPASSGSLPISSSGDISLFLGESPSTETSGELSLRVSASRGYALVGRRSRHRMISNIPTTAAMMKTTMMTDMDTGSAVAVENTPCREKNVMLTTMRATSAGYLRTHNKQSGGDD
jgi:hypothetical protein